MLAQLVGHEERDLEALRSIKAFIDDSVTTLRDHKVRCACAVLHCHVLWRAVARLLVAVRWLAARPTAHTAWR